MQCHNDGLSCLTTVHSWGGRPVDDPHVISGCEDGEIKAWDMRTGQCTATLHGHTDSVTQMLVLHHGRGAERCLLLVSASADTTIKVWELADDVEPEIAGMPNQVYRTQKKTCQIHHSLVCYVLYTIPTICAMYTYALHV